ncbi:MAG: NADH-quinone oxidoreductase subunit NuoE [Burkholderiales bacterium]|jgi:NADH-quinone oxidoreductase subunit E|nr:NADH-quinone oxidoreductase subunit NuoE [Burkholderiales bacterium]
MMKSLLSDQSLRLIETAIAKYPEGRKQSAVMAALTIAQDEHGYLSTDVLNEVARILEMSPMAVYEVASFYSMYRLKPAGRYTLTLCTNLPCALQGAGSAAQYLKSKLNIDFGETTKDGMFTLQQGECMGACGDGPIVLVNHKKMCAKMTREAVDAFIDDLYGSAGKDKR